METSPQAQLAVLIDADNANAKRIDGLLAEVAKYGRATTKRAYGDWTTQNLGSWKQTLARHAIQPMQQFSNTKGKNSTDSALIIDAMDLLYTERFDGFCIVSSDSDFTRLASRIRESGLTVYGFGERKTPQAFVRACDRFIFVEVLRDGEPEAPAEPVARAPERGNPQPGRGAKPAPQAPAGGTAAKPATKPADASAPVADERPARGAPIDDPALLGPLRAAVADAADEDGWVGLGAVGSLLSKRMPEFDPRNYGRKKLSDLIAAIPLFEVEVRGEPGRSRALFMREKRVRDGVEAKAETRLEARPEPKPEVKAETRPETRIGSRIEAWAEARPEPKQEAAPRQPERRPQAEVALHAPPTPKPPQQPRPLPAVPPVVATATGHEGERDWAPRRDDRRPAWAIPKPVVIEEPAAVAPTPVPTPAPAPAPAVPQPTPPPAMPAAAEAKAAAPAKAPRKAAVKKTVAAPATAAAEPVAPAEAAAPKPRRARAPKAAQPAAGKAAKGE